MYFEIRKLSGRAVLALALALLAMAVQPAHGQTGTVLYNFSGGSDGGDPASGLTADGAGNFYGTTYGGGTGFGYGGYGTVFELSPNGVGGWNQTVLYTFTDGADGSEPSYAGVILDQSGNLYGTAQWGGANGYGVVYELTPSGTGWSETVLYNFCSQANCADGANPDVGLFMDSSGNLFGTCRTGNSGAFELSPNGSGGWNEQVIYSYSDVSAAGLTMDAAGNIYGVSTSTVFKLSPNGNGGWNPTVLHTFSGAKDGSSAEGTPILDKAGNVYGTTQGGSKGNGTVYRLSPGKKKWKEKILYSFKGGQKDGSGPFAGVALDTNGDIYGATVAGGANGYGTIFELTAPTGTGSYKEKILWNFHDSDGYQPYYPLTLDSSGNLWGTTAFGGTSGWGVAFELTP